MKIIITFEIMGFVILLAGFILEEGNKYDKQFPSWDTVRYNYYPKIRSRNRKISWCGFILMVIGLLIAVWF